MKISIFALIAAVCLALLSPTRGDVNAAMRPGDSFELRINGVPPDDGATFNGNYTIDGDGNLNLPLLGKLNVSGMTPSQIQSAIEHAYRSKDIYTTPTVTLINSQARFVNVAGQVKAPQRVTWTPDLTVMSAINAAGDFTEFANRKGVRLTREGKVTVVNCKDALRDPSKDVKVLPGDQIQVPESFF